MKIEDSTVTSFIVIDAAAVASVVVSSFFLQTHENNYVQHIKLLSKQQQKNERDGARDRETDERTYLWCFSALENRSINSITALRTHTKGLPFRFPNEI